jgi:MoaA/NifB/PqqE/SkfB family radical SAM enzyme
VFILGGGEPLARRSLIGPLLAAVKHHGLEGVLTTNGTLLSGELAQQLVDTGWDEVHLSIDGDNAATHDRLRGRPGAFRQTVRNACRLGVYARRSGRSLPRIGLHFVITRENFRQLSGMVRLGHALGAHRIDFDALIAYTPDQLRLRLLPEEREALPELAAEAGRLADELGITTTLDHYRTPERAERGKELPIAPKGEGTGLERAPCLKAWHHIVVGPDGRVAPCCVLSGTGGSVADQPLAAVWRRDSFLEEVRAGMAVGQPRARCVECSPNILAHEGLIAASLRELAKDGGPHS